MQERYLGDSHDFIKFALLRHIAHRVELDIGVNWYLTNPEDVDKPGNNDGNKRHHIGGKKWKNWQALDQELFELIQVYSMPENRQISSFQNSNILPEQTVYYDTIVPREARDRWQSNARAQLARPNVIFLDPDNGFEVKSMTQTTAAKYAFYSEMTEWYSAGNVVVCIQFARQCDPIKRGKDVREKLCRVTNCSVKLPIIRGRVAPNILFITLAPEHLVEQMHSVLSSFGEESLLIELIH